MCFQLDVYCATPKFGQKTKDYQMWRPEQMKRKVKYISRKHQLKGNKLDREKKTSKSSLREIYSTNIWVYRPLFREPRTQQQTQKRLPSLRDERILHFLLSPPLSSLLFLWCVLIILTRLGWNSWSSRLSLTNSWDYRPAPLYPLFKKEHLVCSLCQRLY